MDAKASSVKTIAAGSIRSAADLLRRAATADNAVMEAEPSKHDPPKGKRRRWFQFSLRSVMIFTVIIAIGAGWLGKRIEQKRRQREAVEAIGRLGGWISYDYGTLMGVTPPGPEWLRNLLGEDFFCGNAVTVSLSHGTNVSDSALVHLTALPRLQILDLNNTQVTDAGLIQLEGLAALEGLGLGATRVSDTGLVHLKRLQRLKTLYVRGTKITDAGVIEFERALPNCKVVRQ
jgi:hypothetical protein